jgi:hypothetical protein
MSIALEQHCFTVWLAILLLGRSVPTMWEYVALVFAVRDGVCITLYLILLASAGERNL